MPYDPYTHGKKIFNLVSSGKISEVDLEEEDLQEELQAYRAYKNYLEGSKVQGLIQKGKIAETDLDQEFLGKLKFFRAEDERLRGITALKETVKPVSEESARNEVYKFLGQFIPKPEALPVGEILRKAQGVGAFRQGREFIQVTDPTSRETRIKIGVPKPPMTEAEREEYASGRAEPSFPLSDEDILALALFAVAPQASVGKEILSQGIKGAAFPFAAEGLKKLKGEEAEVPSLEDTILSALGFAGVQAGITGAGAAKRYIGGKVKEALKPKLKPGDVEFLHTPRGVIRAFQDETRGTLGPGEDIRSLDELLGKIEQPIPEEFITPKAGVQKPPPIPPEFVPPAQRTPQEEFELYRRRLIEGRHKPPPPEPVTEGDILVPITREPKASIGFITPRAKGARVYKPQEQFSPPTSTQTTSGEEQIVLKPPFMPKEGKFIPPAGTTEPPPVVTRTPKVEITLPKRTPTFSGSTTEAITERGTKIQTEFALVESDDLITSFDPGFPPALQPRQRGTRVTSTQQISDIVKRLEPVRLGESPVVSEGAPIIGDDFLVESGNARVSAIRQVYGSDPIQSQRYKKFLRENAERFGLDPASVDTMRKPVLVRVRKTPVDRGSFVVEANESAVAGFSATELAGIDADKISIELLGELRPTEAGLDAASNTTFIEGFSRAVLSPADRAKFFTPEGAVSQEGVRRMQNAIFSKAYGNPDLVARLAEHPDPVAKNLLNAMLNASPRMASSKAKTISGDLHPLDISDDLSGAAVKYISLKDQGVNVRDYLFQENLFGTNQLEKDILSVIEQYKTKPRAMGEILREYTEILEGLGSPKQTGLIEVTLPNKAMILREAVKRATPEQITIFGDPAPKIPAGVMASIEQMRKSGPSMSDSDLVLRQQTNYTTNSAIKLRPEIIEMPEMVQIAGELMGGKLPQVVKKMRFVKDALGYFRPTGSGEIVLRADMFKDPVQARKTLAHEIGHLVDYVPEKMMQRGNVLGRIASLKRFMQTDLMGFKDKEVREELKELSRIWRPWDPKSAPPLYKEYRNSGPEIYADFISAIFNDPALVQSVAPKAKSFFDLTVNNKPQFQKMYADILNQIGSKTVAQTRNQRIIDEMAETTDSFFEALGKGQDADMPFKAKLKAKYEAGLDGVRWIWERFFEDRQPVLRRIGNMQDIQLAENTRAALDRWRYGQSENELFMGEHWNRVIKPLHEAKIDVDRHFGPYLMARRIITERKDKANPWGLTPKNAGELIDDIEKVYSPEQVKLMKGVVKDFRSVTEDIFIDKLTRLEVFSDDLMEVMRNNENYVKFHPAEFIEQKYGAGMSPYIYSQWGTFQKIPNPYWTTIVNQTQIMDFAHAQHAKRIMVEGLMQEFPDTGIMKATRHWNGKFWEFDRPPSNVHLEAIDGSPITDLDLIIYLHKGEPQGYWVEKGVADIFKSDWQLARTAQVFKLFLTQPLRDLYINYNPGFGLITNPWRDMWSTMINAPKSKFIDIFPEFIKAVKPAWRSVFSGKFDPVTYRMAKGNMFIAAGYRPADIISSDQVIGRELMMKGIIPDTRGRVLKVFNREGAVGKRLGRMLDNIELSMRAMERVPKIAGYNYLNKKFPNMSEQEKGRLVREIMGSPPFLFRGSLYPLYNNMFLFSNAWLQGQRQKITALKADPIGFSMRQSIALLPKAVMWAGMLGLLGTQVQRFYNTVSSYQFNNYWIPPIPLFTEDGKAIAFRMPAGDEFSRVLGGLITHWIRYQSTTQPENLSTDLIKFAMGQTPGLNPGVSALFDTMLYLEGTNPYNWHYGEKAVPDTIWAAQNSETTKYFARYIAGKMGLNIALPSVTTVKEAEKFYEKLFQTPFAGPFLKRFIVVDDKGTDEYLERNTRFISRENARTLLDIREAVNDLSKGKDLTAEQQKAIAMKPKYFKEILRKKVIEKSGLKELEIMESGEMKAKRALKLQLYRKLKGQ